MPTFYALTGTETIANAASAGAQAGPSVSYSQAQTAAPVLDLNGAPAGIDNGVAYTEDGAATVLAPGLTVADADSTTISGATVSIVGGRVAGDQLTLLGGENGFISNINFYYTASTGVMILEGTASLATYEWLMRQVSFETTSNNPGSSRTINWTVNDGGANSEVATTTVTVTAQNDAPVFSVSPFLTRVSGTSGDGNANGGVDFRAGDVSADGTKVVFGSDATDLVASDTNSATDIFLKDLTTGTVTRLSTSAAGAQGTGASFDPMLSADGTKVVFTSLANNLVAGDTANTDVFVKTLATGAIERISVSANGFTLSGAANGVFSPDGTKVAFESGGQIYVKTLSSGLLERVSTDSAGVAGNGNDSRGPVFSPDGTKIAFSSNATNLIAGDTNNQFDIFVKDLVTGAVTRVSVATGGAQADDRSFEPSFSPDGTKIAFRSAANNLSTADVNSGTFDVFVHDLVTGTTTLVSADASGVGANQVPQALSARPFSPDGSTVYFSTNASNLIAGDTNGVADIFGKNLITGAVTRISLRESGAQSGGSNAFDPIVSAGGAVLFRTGDRLVASDTDNNYDQYLVNPGNVPAAYVENGAAVTLVGMVSLSDTDSANFDGGSLNVAITGNAAIGDRLTIAQAGGITTVGNSVRFNGTEIGILTTGTASVTIALDADANAPAVEALAEAIRFDSTSENPGVSTRTATFTLADGDGGSGSFTRTAAVTAINDAPSGANATLVVNEDTPRVFSATDFGFSDVDGNGFSAVVITTLPTAGTLRLSGVAVTAGQAISVGSLSSLVYFPAADANGAGLASFTFQVRDGGGTSNGGQDTDQTPNTITINVTPQNDLASIAAGSGEAAFVEGVNVASTPVAVAPNATVSDVDNGTLAAARVAINNFSAGDVLAFTNNDSAAFGNISASYDSVNGELTMTSAGATATLTQFQNALRAVTFTSTSEDPNSNNRTLSFRADDGSGFGGVSLRQLTVQANNDAPSGTSSTITINEDQVRVLTASDFGFSDVDNDLFAGVRFSSAPTGGTLFYDADGAGGEAPVAITTFPTTTYNAGDVVQGRLSFVPSTDLNGTGVASISFQVVDSGGTDGLGVDTDPTPNTITFNITAENAAPVLDLNGAGAGANSSVTAPDGQSILAAPDAIVSDADNGNFNGGTLTVTPGTGTSANDYAFVRDDGGTFAIGRIGVSGNAIFFGPGNQIGTFTGSEPGGTLVVTLNANATPDAVQAMVRILFVGNVSNTETGTRSFNVTLNDGAGGVTTSQVELTLTAQNDAPSGTDATFSLNEDASSSFTAADFGFSDADGGTLAAVVITTVPAAGSLQLGTVPVTAGQVIAVADVPNLRFVPAADGNGNNYASFTFQVRDDGPTGGDDQNTDPAPNRITFDVTAQNDAPVVSINAPAVRVGNEFPVNTTTQFNQLEPTVTSLALGGFVVTWTDFSAANGNIRAQIFDADGAKVGTELLVNTAILDDQTEATVTALASGRFVVSWTDLSRQGGDASNSGIKAQIFDAAGARVGFEFLINTATANTQNQPAITSLASGGFLVSWSDDSGQGGDASNSGIKAQIFDAAGAKVGSEILVNSATLNAQTLPTISSLASGGFVVSWRDFSGQGGDASSSSVKAQIFDAAGAKVGSEFLVNTTTLNDQSQPTITSLASGGFVVSWEDLSGGGGDPSGSSIKAQIFDAAGAKVGSEFLVNSEIQNGQAQPTITSLASGGFVVSWADGSSRGGDTSSNGIKAQVFDAAGGKVGAEFLVNTATLNNQQQPTITSLASGGFVVSWNDQNGDASFSGIKAQLYALGIRATEQQPLSLKGLVTIADVDAGAGTLTATLAVGFGALNINPGFSGATIVSGNGTGSVVVSGTLAQLNALLHTDGSSTITYTPDTDTPPASTQLSVTVNDGGNTGGAAQTGSDSETITISAINDAPAGSNATLTLDEDAVHGFTAADFGFSDVDGGTFAAVVITTLPGAGQLQLSTVPVTAGQVIAAADIPNLRFVPAPDANGVGYASFTFQVRDDGATGGNNQNTDQSPNTITFNVTPVEDAAVANDDVATVAENDVVTINVLGNDNDVDGPAPAVATVNGAVLAAGQSTILTSGATVTYNANGTLTYDPNGAFDSLTDGSSGATNTSAVDTFAYTVNGGDAANVAVTVTGVAGAGDELEGDGGDNVITGTNGDDTISGGAGEDTLSGGEGSDNLSGGADNDELDGGAGADTIDGGDGDDVLRISGGTTSADTPSETVIGGTGIDTIVIDYSQQTGQVTLQVATQDGDGAGGFIDIPDGTRRVTYSGVERLDITTGGGDDIVRGFALDDTIRTGAGDDLIIAGAGNDLLDGGAGADEMRGGLGDDVFLVDDLGDAVVENGGEGTDEVRTTLTSFSLAGLPNVENLTGAAPGGQTLTGNNGSNVITGNAGADTLDGNGGADTLIGGDGNDIYIVDSLDDVVTEAGTAAAGAADEVRTTLTTFTIPQQVELLTITGAPTGPLAITGNASDNIIVGSTGGADAFFLQQGGDDKAGGGEGDDIFYFGSQLSLGDEIDAGTGSDRVVIQGGYAGFTLGAGNLSGIETLELLSGSDTRFGDTANNLYDYDLTSLDASVTAGGVLVIDAGGLLAGEDFAFDGSAESDGSFAIFADGGGRRNLVGGAQGDGFYLGSALGAGDSVDGRGGADQIALQGNYVSLALAAADFASVETFALLSGGDARFGDMSGNLYDYAVTLTGAWTARTTFNANGLAAGEDMVVSVAATTSGAFDFYAGLGQDILTGGGESDGFFFGDGRFAATDRVDGGGGADDQLALRGDYGSGITLAADTVAGVETIALISATDLRFGELGGTFRYSLTLNDGNVAAGRQLTVTGAMLAAGETMTVDGAAETDGSFRFIGGGAADRLTGGAGDDIIFGGLGADQMVGNGGADRFLYTDTAQSTISATDLIGQFASGDVIDLSAIDAIAGGGGADDAFTFIGTAAFTAAGQVRLVQNGAEWLLEANVDDDLVADLVIGILSDQGYVPVEADLVL
jgi:Ca2+-binding RTX toxin-like protein